MPHVATTDEKATVRKEQQGSLLLLAALHPKIVYQARLNGVPTTTDMVAEIDYDGGVGTLSDIKADMTMYVGTSPEDWDMGTVRIRKTPTSSKFYIGEQSKIDWVDNCYLTVVQEFELRPKHLHINGTTPYIDYDIPYSDQHTNFKPVAVLGSHPVAELIGTTVDVQFGPEPGTASWVFGSTITSYAWTIPDAIAIDDATAVSPIATFDTAGTHVAYCVVTAANGKTKLGVRYAYIYDADNPPTEIYALSSYDEDFDNGGVIFSVDCKYGVNLQDIRPGTLCIFFTRDFYNNEEISLGAIPGQTNIKGIGVISNKEDISYDYQVGRVKFTVDGYQELFKRIYGFPFGLEMANTPAAWTDMPALTVDRALYELLEWYTTATTIMDVILTGDTRYAKELSAPVASLWQQMEKLAFATILANVHVDCLGRFFAEIDPLMLPVADRNYPVIMEIEKQDWKDAISFDYVTDSEVSQVNLSGVAVTLGGMATAFFSLSPGHVFDRTGAPLIVDRLLLETQAKANQLAGLIFSERNNKYPKLTVSLSGNNPLITCFPNQAVTFNILAGDTPRGIALSKNFIPRHRSLKYDTSKMILRTVLTLEAETEETVAVNGDVPGSADFTFPPAFPSFPPFPSSPIILPGTGSTPGAAHPRWLAHDITGGLLYTINFDKVNPDWFQVNAGLTLAQYQSIDDYLICPSGALYVVHRGGSIIDPPFLAWAPYPGALFTIIEDATSLAAKGGYLTALGHNPLKAEEVVYITGDVNTYADVHIGSRNTFVNGVHYAVASSAASISFGFGKWLVMVEGGGSTVYRAVLSPDAMSIVATDAQFSYLDSQHLRAGTSGFTYHWEDGDLWVGTDNLTSKTKVYPALNTALRAVDPMGILLLASSSNAKKSSDGGSSFSSIGTLPVLQNWAFDYDEGAGADSRWVAVSNGGYVYYTEDFFNSSPIDKRGNIPNLIALPHLDIIKRVP